MGEKSGRYRLAYDYLLEGNIMTPLEEAITDGTYPEELTPKLQAKLGGITPEEYKRAVADAAQELLHGKINGAVVQKFLDYVGQNRNADGSITVRYETIEKFCELNRILFNRFFEEILPEFGIINIKYFNDRVKMYLKKA